MSGSTLTPMPDRSNIGAVSVDMASRAIDSMPLRARVARHALTMCRPASASPKLLGRIE